MKTYCVQILEVHRQDVIIEATSPKQALDLVERGAGDAGEMHYDYTLESDEWPVFEVI